MLRSSGFQKSGTGRAGGSGKQPKCPGTNAGPARPLIAPCLHLGNFLHITEFGHQRMGDETPTALEVIISVPDQATSRAAAGGELSQPQQGFPELLCSSSTLPSQPSPSKPSTALSRETPCLFSKWGFQYAEKLKSVFFSSIRVQKIEIQTGRCFAFKQRIH